LRLAFARDRFAEVEQVVAEVVSDDVDVARNVPVLLREAVFDILIYKYYIYIYMHTYIHAYIHTYIHT
jgi:hypothetical protein